MVRWDACIFLNLDNYHFIRQNTHSIGAVFSFLNLTRTLYIRNLTKEFMREVPSQLMGDSPKNYTFIFFPEIHSSEYPCLNPRRFKNIAADVIIIVITNYVPETFQSSQVIYSSHNITSIGFSFWCRNPMLRFGVLPSVDVACEECCCCMQRCWFPQTLPTRQPSRCMSTDLTPD